jgi:hypothetical protein
MNTERANASEHYKSVVVDRVQVVQWTGPTTVTDLRALLAEIDVVADKTLQNVVHVSIVMEGWPSMSTEARSEILRTAPRLMRRCDAIYNVVRGTGFWASAVRGVFTGLTLAAGVRGKVHTEPSVESALSHMRRHYGVQTDALAKRLRAAEML